VQVQVRSPTLGQEQLALTSTLIMATTVDDSQHKCRLTISATPNELMHNIHDTSNKWETLRKQNFDLRFPKKQWGIARTNKSPRCSMLQATAAHSSTSHRETPARSR